MKTAVLAYPRIGEKRELKKITELYFKGQAKVEELDKVAKELRKKHWLSQKDRGVDFISSNDFSFYDLVLDTAFTLNVIPKRYKELGLSYLETYFAMARGYQNKEKHIDVKALDMKKWFNTNYHYVVPELNEDIEIKLNSNKIFLEYEEAKEIGIETKPLLIGPFTFLKLTKFNEGIKLEAYVDSFIKVYKEIILKLEEKGVKYLQLDEPYLVKDLNKEEINLFIDIYKKLLGNKKELKIILATYFGDVRDIYGELINLDFDGITIDFVEGKESLALIEKYGYPKDKLLFAGIINGKNIWRNDYKKSINKICQLKKLGVENLILSTSCSLLHVPYTLENEIKLDDKYKEHLAFANEKLFELEDIKAILLDSDFDDAKILSNSIYLKNQVLKEKRKSLNELEFPEISKEIAELKVEDFKRNKVFEERIKEQRKELKLPLLPTTTIGSFPQTQEIRKTRSAYRKKLINENEYNFFIKNEIEKVIKLQEELLLDVLVHGEFERNDMVEYFGENFEGFIFTENAWVQSYGTRGVKPPIIFGDVRRPKAITTDWIAYAQSLTNKPVKGMLTGPVTIYNWSFPREDKSPKEVIYQIALGVRAEVLDLERIGTKIIQIDEAALREKLPIRKTDWEEYLAYAIDSFCLVHSKVKNTTQIHTHMCYSEFKDIMKAISKMDVDVITIEAAKSNLSMLSTLKEGNYTKEVGPGVYDIHSARVPSKEELKEVVEKMVDLFGKNRIWVNPDCGLKTRGASEVYSSLKNMVEVAIELRNQ